MKRVLTVDSFIRYYRRRVSPGLDVWMEEGEDVVEGGQQRLAGGAGVGLLGPHHGHLLPDTQPGPPGRGPPGMEAINIRDTS